jgi:hypothetical protein
MILTSIFIKSPQNIRVEERLMDIMFIASSLSFQITENCLKVTLVERLHECKIWTE